MAQDNAIGRLARQITAARKSEQFLEDQESVAMLRRKGACELHRIAADFVASVNRDLPKEAALELSPQTYAPESFREPGVNLIQVSSHGRQIQVAFQAPPQLFSTEKFLVPYILEGEVRAYNQKMLERFDIRSLLLFLCVEEGIAGWRFFEWRTRRTGPVDWELLARLMEPLF